MTEWEYRKIDLNHYDPRGSELELLNAAGALGWESVGITSYNVAYLKRELEHAPSPTVHNGGPARHEDEDAHAHIETESPQGVKAKYRDPKTNETWSGRGRMATWLKRKQDAGEDIDDYLV